MAIPAFDITKDLESLTNFKRNSNVVMKQIRKTGRPVALTVKGKAQAVLMAPGQYQRMADRLQSIERIAQSMAQVQKRELLSMEEVFDELDSEG
jgi:PHD/YefM family antitoxin component YafN of YafNO toxin-antitoxin module